MIPWRWIVDETRDVEQVATWADPHDYVNTVMKSYRRDRWQQQPAWLEYWSEKGTVRGTLTPVLDEYGIAFRVMHGFGSATAVYQAAKDSMERVGKVLEVLYVGDWDPSGLYMSEIDLPARLERYDGYVEIQRLALTAPDTRSGLPSFPADSKSGDPRYRWFRQHYGARCWELDSLSPVVLRTRAEQAIRQRLDLAAWNRAEVAERAERESLVSILSAWPSKSGQVSKCPRRME